MTWDRFDGTPGVDVELDPETVHERLPDGAEFRGPPPVSLLRSAKWVAERANVPVVYYDCLCWGGTTEVEYAWIFDGSERVLVRVDPFEVPAVGRLVEIDRDTSRVIDEDVLVRALRCLSCHLPTPYFAPHTGKFEWEHRRLFRELLD